MKNAQNTLNDKKNRMSSQQKTYKLFIKRGHEFTSPIVVSSIDNFVVQASRLLSCYIL